jgi:hypothetical protein
MKKMLLLLALLLLAACAAKPVHYGIARLDNLKPGVTTQQDLIRTFGMPTYTFPTSEGGQVWNWQYPPTSTETGDGLQLFGVILNSDGQMVRISRVVRQ